MPFLNHLIPPIMNYPSTTVGNSAISGFSHFVSRLYLLLQIFICFVLLTQETMWMFVLDRKHKKQRNGTHRKQAEQVLSFFSHMQIVVMTKVL